MEQLSTSFSKTFIYLDKIIPMTGRIINNPRYADDTTLMAESEELKSLLMKVKEESEKACLDFSIQKIRSSHPVPSLHGK